VEAGLGTTPLKFQLEELTIRLASQPVAGPDPAGREVARPNLIITAARGRQAAVVRKPVAGYNVR
jgi:hypothetical protein